SPTSRGSGGRSSGTRAAPTASRAAGSTPRRRGSSSASRRRRRCARASSGPWPGTGRTPARMPLAESALRALRAVARWRPPPRLGPLAREPWAVLAPLLLLQWAALLAFALTVRHNGWLYYQGGDETF